MILLAIFTFERDICCCQEVHVSFFFFSHLTKILARNIWSQYLTHPIASSHPFSPSISYCVCVHCARASMRASECRWKVSAFSACVVSLPTFSLGTHCNFKESGLQKWDAGCFYHIYLTDICVLFQLSTYCCYLLYIFVKFCLLRAAAYPGHDFFCGRILPI